MKLIYITAISIALAGCTNTPKICEHPEYPECRLPSDDVSGDRETYGLTDGQTEKSKPEPSKVSDSFNDFGQPDGEGYTNSHPFGDG